MVQAIPNTMFAWRKHKGNPEPVWEEIPVPSVAPSGALVKLRASGVCHSDYSLLTNENQRPWFQDKYTLAHEGCGEIVQLGERAKDHGLQLGDLVATMSVIGCDEHDCPECSRDLSQLCERSHHAGIGQDGFFAPYVALDVKALVKVPDGISPSVAAVATDAVTTSYHAVAQRGRVQRHETVFLFGLGGLGFNGLEVVRSIGARVLVSDVKQDRLDEAVRIGVPREDIVPVGKPVQDFVRERGLSGKIDVTLDFVGKHQTFSDAQSIVRRGGRMTCIGTLDNENTIDMKNGIRKRLEIIFSYGGQIGDLRKALQLIAAGTVKPQVTNGKLQDFPRVLKELHEGRINGRVALLHD